MDVNWIKFRQEVQMSVFLTLFLIPIASLEMYGKGT